MILSVEAVVPGSRSLPWRSQAGQQARGMRPPRMSGLRPPEGRGGRGPAERRAQ